MKNSFFWNIFLPSPLLLEKPGYSFLLTCIVLLKQDRAAVISEIQGAEVCCSHQQERGMEILLSLSFSSRALKQFSSGGFQNPPQQPSGEHTVVCLEDMWMQLCHEMHFKVPAVLCFTKQWQKGLSCRWLKVESSPNYLVCHHQIIWHELWVELNCLTLDFVLDPSEMAGNTNSSAPETESVWRISIPFVFIEPPCKSTSS